MKCLALQSNAQVVALGKQQFYLSLTEVKRVDIVVNVLRKHTFVRNCQFISTETFFGNVSVLMNA